MQGQARAAGSPITYVSRNDPPFYITHGLQNPLVPPDQARELAFFNKTLK